MRKHLATVLYGVGGAVMVIAGVVGIQPSDASPVPSACVYVSADVGGVVTTTIVKDTDGMTCPSLPPDSDDPCPHGDVFTRPTVTAPPLDTEVDALVCIDGIL